jgi:L-seryl-tRNA(Ser) seleniumtransferase
VTERLAQRAIPSLDRLLRLPDLVDLVQRFGRTRVTEVARAELAACRAALAAAPGHFDEAGFISACAERLDRETRNSIWPMFNLTGTVLHTNLGRALMPQAAVDAVMTVMTRPGQPRVRPR